MTSIDLRPAQHSDFCRGDGLIQDRLPIVKKGVLEGRADDPNNIVILVGPTKEEFIVNKCLAKLSSSRLEKAIDKASELNGPLKFPEIVPKSFQTMLECAMLEMHWKFTNLEETCDLIETASQFGFYSFIEDICELVFREVESKETVFEDEKTMELFLFQCFGIERLRAKALEYILENGASIFRGNQFLQLSLEDFSEILIQDELKIESEIEVLNAVIGWGLNVLKNENKLGSSENLRNALAEPLNWIRFPNMSKREFRDYVIPLQILTDEQIKAMELWYSSGGPISAFNSHPREYLIRTDAKAAANDCKNVYISIVFREQFLHAVKIDNGLAKFNMKIQIHNVEVEARNARTKLESIVDTSFEKVQKVMEANNMFRKLEALQNYPGNSRKNEDLCELGAKIEEPYDIILSLLEYIETIENKITELEQAQYSKISEYLFWKIFQKETNSAVVDLLKFPDIQMFACAIVFKNNTSETLQNFQNYTYSAQVSMALPSNIQPFCTHNYLQTSSCTTYTAGILSYDIGSIRIVIRHCFSSNENDLCVALVPSTYSMCNDRGSGAWMIQDWTNDPTKIKALCRAPEEMEKCIQLGRLCLHAELMGIGPKAVLRVLLTAL